MSNAPHLPDSETLLESIKTRDGRKKVVVLEDDKARTVLMLLQEELKKPSTRIDPMSRQSTLKVMIELAKRSGQFPPTFWLSNVCQGEHVTGGGFGDVYKGSWRNENAQVPVALKISRGRPDLQKQKQFCQEALLWCQLSHQNILPFFGLYKNGPEEPIMMVSPWMHNGNILQYLEIHPNADMYRLLINASEGLSYLHELDPPMLHSDLKPENILIDDNDRAVLADFGLTRVQHNLTDLLSSTQNSGTMVYMSPELLRSKDGKSTKPSDVWAFGMVIYQVFTRKPPYFGKFPFNEICHSPPRLPTKPKETAIDIGFTDGLWDFLEKHCWAQSSRERPTARNCCKALQDLRSRYLRVNHA